MTSPSATSFSVDATWNITEANPGKSVLELSNDGGTTYTTLQSVAGSGSSTAALVLPLTGQQAILRLTIKDQAGNRTVGITRIAVPVAPDPEKDLAAAVANLPALESVQPPSDDTKAAETPDETVLSPTAQALTGSELPAASTTRATTVPTARFLFGDDAQNTLADARAKRDKGDVDGALAAYLRLQSSDVAEDAAIEAISMLQGYGDHAAVIDLATNLPVENRTEAVRLGLADSFLAFHRWDDAEQQVRTIRRSSPRARQGLLVFAKSSLGRGEEHRFNRIVDVLVQGDDDVAVAAKGLRGGH